MFKVTILAINRLLFIVPELFRSVWAPVLAIGATRTWLFRLTMAKPRVLSIEQNNCCIFLWLSVRWDTMAIWFLIPGLRTIAALRTIDTLLMTLCSRVPPTVSR